MTEEQYNRAVRIHDTLDRLVEVREQLGDRDKSYLSYMVTDGIDYSSKYQLLDGKLGCCINDILEKHDKMIRVEIDEEIAKLKKEIEKL